MQANRRPEISRISSTVPITLKTELTADEAADEAMSGITNVGQCVYFRTPIEGLTGLRIGGHIFY